MANAFHTLARPEAVLDAGVSDAAFKAAMRFVGRRYLRGIAVVATCIGEQLWLGIERQELSADGARLGRLVSILRKCAGSYISVTSMCRVDLELQRAALADELDVRERVLRVMVRLLFEMEALGLGAIAVAGTGQPPYLVKHSQRHLAPHTQRWLLQHRVPLDLFPLGETAVVRDGLATGRVASDGGGHADVVASRVGRAVLLTSPARGATLGASSFAFQENVSESDAGCGDGFAVPLTVEELSLARAAQTDASSASGTHDQPGREAKSPDAPVAIVARRRARVAAAAAMNIAYTDVLQEALEDRKAFKGHCVRWLRLVNMRYAVEKTCYDEERWQRVVLCRESLSRRVRVTLTYYVRATTLPAKSFVVVTRGDHDHSDQGAASGKLWSPQAEFLAREYKASAAKATVQGLLAHLHASGVPGPFPDRPRISNWLRHLKCGPSRAEQPASQHVETGRHSIEAWCEKPSEQDRTRLWVLQPYVLTGVSVRVLFASHGMLSHTLDRYDGGRVHLSVDGKWKVSDKGWAILTVSVLVKDVPRPTHLAHGVRKSVQSKATTTRALPLLQALVQSETTEDVVAVFRALAAHWESRHPDRRSLYQLVKQVHKDYAPALEAARATVFPRSRPVNDFFHLREKDKILAAKCAKLDLRHGKYVKRHFEWTMYTLTNTRVTPHPEVFSMVWQGFLVRLLTVGETQVATYLRAEYSSLVDAETVEFADTPTHVVWSPGQRLFFAPHWAGLWGVYPGTASGNQAGEALHAPWQRTLESLRTTPSIDNIFDVMQGIYTNQWSSAFEWASNAPLGPDPRVLEPGLLNGAVLSRVGRSTAVAFVDAASGGRTIHMLRHVDAAVAVVAMSRTADAGLDEAAATLGIDIMFAKDTKHRQTLLAAAGILAPMAPQVKNVVDELEKIQWPHDVLEDSAPIVFQNAPFNKIFGDLVYVVATPSEHGCTCGPYMMYKQCEHVVYAESLDVAFRASTRDFATLPAKQKRGRPRGRVVPARDRRAANM